MLKPDPLELALALLQEVKECGKGPILRTVYHKLFYLVDLFYAEEQEGQPATDFEWKFVHFGPFSTQAAAAIQQAESSPLVESERNSKAANDDEFFTYQLRNYGKVKDLRELGFSSRIQRQIQQVIRSRSDSVNQLLEYVYFSTSPMESATPGSILSFTSCRKFNVADYKHVPMKPLSKAAISKAQQLIRASAAKRQATSYREPGEFDSIYFQQIGALEESDFEAGANGTAELNF